MVICRFNIYPMHTTSTRLINHNNAIKMDRQQIQFRYEMRATKSNSNVNNIEAPCCWHMCFVKCRMGDAAYAELTCSIQRSQHQINTIKKHDAFFIEFVFIWFWFHLNLIWRKSEKIPMNFLCSSNERARAQTLSHISSFIIYAFAVCSFD